MEEKGLREGEASVLCPRSLGGHGNYIFMRWFRQMAPLSPEDEEEGGRRGDENRKRGDEILLLLRRRLEEAKEKEGLFSFSFSFSGSSGIIIPS